jgi:hypothetical protein
LSDNQFSGQISTNISDLINLKRLKINNNQFSGEIPGTLCDIYSNLVFFDISNNNLCPSYPDCLINQELFDVDSDYNENGIWDEGEPFVDTNGNGIYEEDYVGEQDTTNCSTMSITDNLIPTTYTLSSPYPNPFNPTTTISFSIPQSGMVSFKVYDITGKLITTLINEQLHIGYHSIDWDGTNQSSGMYLVRMESGDYVETQKLLLVK